MDKKEILTPFINLQTDFGFKHVFGNVANKRALIRFLNILFKGEFTVTDVIYHDKEKLPAAEEGKRLVYDVYCTTNTRRTDSTFFPTYQIKEDKGEIKSDHHFILEMQNAYVPPFEERIIYYASKVVADQGKAGWDYNLEPVVAIAVTDFNFSHLYPKLVRDIMLLDRESSEPLSNKIHLIFCSLKEVPAKWVDCKTETEQILFLIKNMDKMDYNSSAYTNGAYSDIFDAAKSNSLSPDQIADYNGSLEQIRDIQLAIDYQAAQAAIEATEQVAKNLMNMGLNDHIIHQATGLSLSQITVLRASI